MSNATVVQKFQIEAAHRLPNLPSDHKCYRLHGHSYLVEVRVLGPIQLTRLWRVSNRSPVSIGQMWGRWIRPFLCVMRMLLKLSEQVACPGWIFALLAELANAQDPEGLFGRMVLDPPV